MKQAAPTVATITIGQTPRDDVVPAMRAILPDDIRIVEFGALDGLSTDEIANYASRDGEVGIVTRLRDDSSVLLSHELILPRMQELVDSAIATASADVIVILCGADWTALEADRLIINPGKVFPAVVSALATGSKLGVIKPDAGQVEREAERYRTLGIDVAVTSASPYAGPERLRLAREAGSYLADQKVDLIWMTCVGMDEQMRDVVSKETGKPVILAQSLLARLVAEVTLAPVSVPAIAAD